MRAKMRRFLNPKNQRRSKEEQDVEVASTLERIVKVISVTWLQSCSWMNNWIIFRTRKWLRRDWKKRRRSSSTEKDSGRDN